MGPLQSLEAGHWFKLICGASFQHLPSVRTLSLAYSLAGADCIDVAADPGVIRMAREAITIARTSASAPNQSPWLMVSINDGEDPHFRKALFNPKECPESCSQPCIPVCPADAITPQSLLETGVVEERCYGCGRCLTICPTQQIDAISHQIDIHDLQSIFQNYEVDALEIHTQVGHFENFKVVWQNLQPILPQLKLLAISCPYESGVLNYLLNIQELIAPLPCPLLWQTDGRPMSGDIGDGTTRTTVKYAQQALESELEGFIQVAGGTNGHTVEKLKALGLLKNQKKEHDNLKSRSTVAGIAYGSYGRALFDTLQADLDQYTYGSQKIEEIPALLAEAIQLAESLVHPLKYHRVNHFQTH